VKVKQSAVRRVVLTMPFQSLSLSLPRSNDDETECEITFYSEFI